MFNTRDDCRPGSSLREWKIIKFLEEKGDNIRRLIGYPISGGREESFYTPSGAENAIASYWRRYPYVWAMVIWYFIIYYCLLTVLRFCRNMGGYLWLEV
jgi:hypothetical protein